MNSPREIKHLLFDLDHTLWDFDGNSLLAMRELYSKFGLEEFFVSFDAFHDVYLGHNKRLWRDYAAGTIGKEQVSVGRFYLPLLEHGSDNYARATQMAEFYLQATSDRTGLMPHALQTLEALAPRYTMHVVTNGFREVQHKKVANSGLGQYISHVFISDEIGAMKPSTEYFSHVLRAINATPDQCALIGDSPESDIEGALNSGITPVFYNSRGVEPLHQGVATIASLSELPALLESLQK